MIYRHQYILRRLNNLVDAATTIFVFVLVYTLRNNLPQIDPLRDLGYLLPFKYYAPLMVIAAFLWPVLLNYHGLYNPSRLRKAFVNVGIIFRSSLTATLILVGIIFLFQLEIVSRFFLVGFGLSNACALVFKDWARRRFALYRREQGSDVRSVMIVGTEETAQEAIGKIREEHYLGLNPVAIVLVSEERELKAVEGVPVVGSLQAWRELLHQYPVSTVLFTVYREYTPEVEEALWICQEEGVESWLFAGSFGWSLPRMEIDYLAATPILIFRTSPVLNWAYVFKLLFDRVLALFLILLLSPLFILISLAVRITSGSPVFLKQVRLGRHCQPFFLYKFRTLKEDSNTPTPIGEWLRHVGLDEIPQLFNILKGEMSFVGPRPHVPEEVNRYTQPWQRRRFSMIPGLTCYRQILKEGKVSFDEALNLDLKYIDKWSLWLDFFLIFRTGMLLLKRLVRTIAR